MEYQIIQLNNGIRLVHKHTEAYVAHLGVVINAGSRDETESEFGIAHFIEHTLFKGTTKRKAFHLLSRMENVGGEVNAFTTKEETCIYTSFMPTYYGRAAELLSDVCFNATFPEKEIEKEKEVIIDEINSYKDEPHEEIYDEFEEHLFQGHELAHNILGSQDSVKSFSRADIKQFTAKHYIYNNIVICSVGNIQFNKLINIIQKYFSDTANEQALQSHRERFISYKPFNIIKEKAVSHTHCLMGCEAYSSNDNKRITLMLLDNLLGGPAMNSRLSLQIREKYGYSYNIGSGYTPFSDTGVFNIYVSCDNGNIYRTIDLINAELKKLRDIKLGTLQLTRAKSQMMGQIAISFESNLNEMLSIGKSLIIFNNVDTLEKVFSRINAVTSENIIEIANELFSSGNISTLIYKPLN